MLPKRQRLHHQELKEVAYTSRREHAPHLMLAYTETSHEFKAVVIVSKKVSKKAVERNRTRRMLYSVLAKNREALQHGVYIVRVKVAAKSIADTQLKQELQQLLNRLLHKS